MMINILFDIPSLQARGMPTSWQDHASVYTWIMRCLNDLREFQKREKFDNAIRENLKKKMVKWGVPEGAVIDEWLDRQLSELKGRRENFDPRYDDNHGKVGGKQEEKQSTPGAVDSSEISKMFNFHPVVKARQHGQTANHNLFIECYKATRGYSHDERMLEAEAIYKKAILSL